MKFEVEYAKFIKMVIEADSDSEAQELAHIIDDDIIERDGRNENPTGYIIWNEPKKILE